MKPIKFKEQNIVIARDQKQYIPLPAHKAADQDGIVCVVSCWEGTILERLKFLFRGKLYLSVTTFNKPLQPLFMTIDKWSILNKKCFKK